jgi:hypothetical protein
MFVTFTLVKSSTTPSAITGAHAPPALASALTDDTYHEAVVSLGTSGKLRAYGIPLADTQDPTSLDIGQKVYATITRTGTAYVVGAFVHTCEAYNWFNKQSPTGVVPFLGGLQGTAGTSVVYIVPLTMGA